MDTLADFVATKQAYDYLDNHNSTLKAAKGMFIRRLRKRWGLQAHRLWAQLLLLRSKSLTSGAAYFPDSMGLGLGGGNMAEDDVFMEYNNAHPDAGFSPFRG